MTENLMMGRNLGENMSSVDGLLRFRVETAGGCVRAMGFVRDGNKFESHQGRDNIKTQRWVTDEKAKE